MNFDLLKNLTKKHSVTSDTSFVKKYIKQQLEDLEIEYFEDGFGSIVFGNIAGEVMLTAHLDEVGFQVAKINENGTLQILPVGDVAANTLNNSVVYVKTLDDEVYGAIFSLPNLRKNNIENFSDLFLDIGTSTKVETLERGIRVGQTGTFKKEYFEQGDNIFATGIDDKVSVFAILNIIKDNPDFLNSAFVAFHTDEEMQNHSANSLTVQFKPEFALILDYFPVHQNPGDNDFFSDVGEGPIAFYRGGNHILHEDLRKKLDSISNLNKGFVSPSTMQSLEPQNYENNGRTKAMNLNIPARGYHSGVYSIKKNDIKLFIEYIQIIVNVLLN